MRNSTLKIENNGTFIQFDVETSNSKSFKKVQYNLVLRFFDWYDTMRRIGAKGFKATEPFKLSMVINNAVVWDTTRMSVEAQARLKLQNTIKGRGRFEYNLTELVALMGRLQEKDIDTFNAEAEKRLLAK